MEKSSTENSKTTANVQVLDRMLDIIELLSSEHREMGVTEISKHTSLHKSTTFRLLNALANRGYIEKNPDNGAYRIGLKLIEVVSYYINSLELQTESRSYLWDLTKRLNLTSHLGLLDGRDIVYVEHIDVFAGARLFTQIGFRAPAYCTAHGKCLLAQLSDLELDTLLKNYNFELQTEHTVPDIQALKNQLRQIKIQGYAIDDEEFETGMRCIGTPIYDYRGEVIAAISVSGTTSSINPDNITSIIDTVKETALQISRRLGYTL